MSQPKQKWKRIRGEPLDEEPRAETTARDTRNEVARKDTPPNGKNAWRATHLGQPEALRE